jgi:predicted transcriptional regulator
MYYMSTLTVRIPDELKAQLEELSRRLHRPVSDLVRESLRQFVVQEELRQLRAKLRPYAEAAGFFTDEDVFEVVS